MPGYGTGHLRQGPLVVRCLPKPRRLTIEVSYDESGIVHHLHFGVEPPQPGTGIDATWVTGYTLDVTALNLPVAIRRTG